MPEKPELRYQITLNFPGEPRVSDYSPTDLGAAVEYALDFAKQNKGVKVQVAVSVPMTPLHCHSYTIFECHFPALEPFMTENVRKYYGKPPY